MSLLSTLETLFSYYKDNKMAFATAVGLFEENNPSESETMYQLLLGENEESVKNLFMKKREKEEKPETLKLKKQAKPIVVADKCLDLYKRLLSALNDFAKIRDDDVLYQLDFDVFQENIVDVNEATQLKDIVDTALKTQNATQYMLKMTWLRIGACIVKWCQLYDGPNMTKQCGKYFGFSKKQIHRYKSAFNLYTLYPVLKYLNDISTTELVDNWTKLSAMLDKDENIVNATLEVETVNVLNFLMNSEGATTQFIAGGRTLYFKENAFDARLLHKNGITYESGYEAGQFPSIVGASENYSLANEESLPDLVKEKKSVADMMLQSCGAVTMGEGSMSDVQAMETDEATARLEQMRVKHQREARQGRPHQPQDMELDDLAEQGFDYPEVGSQRIDAEDERELMNYTP